MTNLKTNISLKILIGRSGKNTECKNLFLHTIESKDMLFRSERRIVFQRGPERKFFLF
jgi:hypothetical protein